MMYNSAVEFLYSTVRRHPSKICLADQDSMLSFEEFFAKAFALSQMLSHDSRNAPVLVFLPKSVEAVVSFAAILLSGNFYIPIDTKSPQRRLVNILENIQPYKVVTSKFHEKEVRALGIETQKLIFFEACDPGKINLSIDEMIGITRRFTNPIIDMDPCYVMYTSGSTGTPKGVVIPHRGVIDYIQWAISCLEVSSQEVIGNQAPLFFDNSTLDIYLCWATGAKLILTPTKHFLFPTELLDFLEQQRITFVFYVPSVLVQLAKMKLLKPGMLPNLKKVVFAGEVMPTKHLSVWQKNLPHATYVNLYGPTEITVDCTYFIADRLYDDNERLPIGYPCHNSGILILEENGQPVKTGEQGELCVRGSSLALGYWGDFERSEDVFSQNPLQSNYYDRIYRTGDIVYVNAKGQIIFVGRKDAQIKHMGYRIELGEIETAAMTLPFVNKCCALYNDNKAEINLFCEVQDKQPLKEVRKSLATMLPSYSMPRKIHFFNKLPLTPNGKIDRKALTHAFS